MNSICYLMRGLPSTGKSYTAKKLAGDSGIICETDEYFYTQLGFDPTEYDFDSERMIDAREWNFERFKDAVDAGNTRIVVDRGNGLTWETRRYAIYAQERGYQLELAEPDSTWWAEIRVLLKYRQYNLPVLRAWALRLAEMSQVTHCVPLEEIWRRMNTWRHGLVIDDILSLKEPVIASAPNAKSATEKTLPVDQASELSIDSSTTEKPENQTTGDDWLKDLVAGGLK